MQSEQTVQAEDSGQRLDLWCVFKFPEQSRSSMQAAIKEGGITVNGKIVKPKHLVQEGDVVVVAMKDAAVSQEEIVMPTIPILYEDEHIVVINKPPGITVHPAPGVRGATVSDWFSQRYGVTNVGDTDRPGVVHRLDKDTSGAMVLARTPKAFERLKEQFKKHRVRKEYMAIVYGIPNARDGRIVQPLGRSPRNPARRTIMESGKPAITEWKIERTLGNDYALLRVFPLTGRTHQIRVHLHFISHPIVGDHLYVFKRKRPPQGVKRQMLHAEKLSLQLMDGKKKTFEAPLPDDFERIIEEFTV